MLSLIFSKQMTNRRFPIHSLSSLSRYPSARNPARYGEIRSPSIIECALSPWTACAVFLPRRVTVQITNAAPIPAGVSPVAPAAGATVRLPFFVDWSDTPNPQVPGYDLEFNTSPNFPLASMVLLVSPSRSDYMITRDLLAPGNYFWRVRALHGDVAGLWSAGRAITVTAPVAPPDVNLFAILAEPVNAYGGNTAHARVMLDNPAPAGGAVVSISTDIPQVNMPATTVTVPAGRTDATISNIATGPVPNNGGGSVGIIGDLFAGFANGRGTEFVRHSSDSLRHEFE